jgi:hypothetical protein
MIAAGLQNHRSCSHMPMRFSAYVLLLCSCTIIHANSMPRLMPPEAIAFSEFLGKAEFDQRYPGEAVKDPTAVPQGWYVRYQHESLLYLFGPLRFAATAEDYAASLRRIVAEAVAQRPELANHSIAVVSLPLDEYARANDAVAPVSEEPVDGNGAPPSPPPPKPWWQRVLGVFRR